MNYAHNGQQRKSYDNSKADKSGIIYEKITLDYIKDGELFNETAKKTANSIKISQSQIRRFYDYVLDLCEKAKTKNSAEILPFVKMLNSKVAYASSRKNVSKNFVEFIKDCVSQVDSVEKLEVFKLFFEAVLGFSKK